MGVGFLFPPLFLLERISEIVNRIKYNIPIIIVKGVYMSNFWFALNFALLTKPIKSRKVTLRTGNMLSEIALFWNPLCSTFKKKHTNNLKYTKLSKV